MYRIKSVLPEAVMVTDRGVYAMVGAIDILRGLYT